MNLSSGASRSYWNESASIPHHSPLKSSPSVDVCIIGAGISGLTAAYLLLRRGKSVVVLEQAKIAGGDTGRTTAHLSPIMDDGLAQIEKWHGVDGARKVFESHAAAIDLIETIVHDEKIDCDFSRLPAYLFAAAAGSSAVHPGLSADLAAAERIRIPVSRVDRAPLPEFDTGPALHFPNQAQFHAVKYLRALSHSVSELGGTIYDQTHVFEIEQGNPARVNTQSGHHVKARFVIEAANSLVSGSARTITKLYPYRTFAIAAEIPHGSVAPALFWDTADPYHYVRTQPTEDPHVALLIIGGEDHKTGQADDAPERYAKLEAWARRRWPKMQAVKYRWSGQVLETLDGLALIGQNPGNEANSFLITGDSGHGITHGTLGAMIIADLIEKKENPYAKLYSPSRFHVKSVGPWIEENANVAKQYGDWFAGSDVANVADIPPGEGAIMRDGLSKIAVYKSPEGKVSACSAVCTHLGGIIAWNREEKTWDCPCHGSRFDAHGKVIATPAVDDLARHKI